MVSNRTIRYDLDHIDSFLELNKIKKLSRRPDERIKLILLKFLENDDFITIDMIAKDIMVSRSTINSDMKKVKEICKDYGLQVKYVQRHGLKLIGNEKNKRAILSQMWLDYVWRQSIKNQSDKFSSEDSFKYKKLIYKLKGNIDSSLIETCVNIIEKELSISYSDVAYANIIANICIMINRLKLGKTITAIGNEEERIMNTREFKVVNSFTEIIENYYKISIPISEVAYMTTYFLGGSLLENDIDSSGEWIHIQLIAKKIIEYVNEQIVIDISHDWRLFRSLLEHIKPMLYRLRYGIKLENPILTRIKDEYNSLFLIVKKSIVFIEEYIGTKMDDEEIGYLTLLFGAAIEREKVTSTTKPKVIIVCNTGYSTSELVSVQIQSMFDVDIVGTVSNRQLRNILNEDEVDVIISTVEIDKNIKVKSVTVNPILTDENVKSLNSMFLKSSKHKIEINGLIKIIKESCEIKDYSKLERDLHNVFNMGLMKDEEGGPMLIDIITDETIELNVDVENWEDAVRKGGILLEKCGAIENRYIDAMVNTVKEIGPYIVVTEGIAMPHARPENGALKVGMSLITLKNPIEFGNEENDPVKLVISFCSKDSKTHLKALSELMVLLDNNEAINDIIEAKTKGEVINIIKRFSF